MWVLAKIERWKDLPSLYYCHPLIISGEKLALLNSNLSTNLTAPPFNLSIATNPSCLVTVNPFDVFKRVLISCVLLNCDIKTSCQR